MTSILTVFFELVYDVTMTSASQNLKILSSFFELYCSFYGQYDTGCKAHNLEVDGSNPSAAAPRNQNYQILNFDFLLSIKKPLTVSLVNCSKDFPNFSIFSIILGGTVIM